MSASHRPIGRCVWTTIVVDWCSVPPVVGEEGTGWSGVFPLVAGLLEGVWVQCSSCECRGVCVSWLPSGLVVGEEGQGGVVSSLLVAGYVS